MDSANRTAILNAWDRLTALQLLVMSMALGACYSGAAFNRLGADNAGGDNETVVYGSDGGLTILETDAYFDVSVPLQVKAILDQTCAGGPESVCHSHGTGNMYISSVSGDFASIINIPSYEMPDVLRVAPFDPDHSYVYTKLVCDGGIVGLCMPRSTSPADPTTIELFREWIEGGAQLPSP
jgi:hypothetical protein